MPKPKQRTGLQKDFSAIFQGVWVPQKPHTAQPTDASTSHEHQQKTNQAEQTEQAQRRENAQKTEQANHTEQIEQIIRSMKCAKDFECFKSGFQKLCKVKNVGEGKIIECSPENRFPCEYRFSFMGKTFCKCQLRYYIARNLNK